jgi:hypothetical protein
MTTRLKSLADASDTVLECRDLGHAWHHVHDPHIVTGPRNQIIEFTREAKCLRCESVRRQRIDVTTWSIVTTTMHYVSDYLLVKGAPRVRRYEVRQEAYNRFFRPKM